MGGGDFLIQPRTVVKTARHIAVVCSVVLVLIVLPSIATACPMCNQAIQEDKSLPMAFQASILFMLAMPFTVLGGLSALIVYKFRKHEQAMRGVYANPAVSQAAPTPAGEVGLRV